MITRHNYEEQFLLYLDNELSQENRLSVEAFVKDNPDLLEEFDTFRQCRLIPEEGPSFGNPAPLLKIAATGPFLLPARTYRITRIAAAALLLLLTSLIVLVRLRPFSSGSQHASLTKQRYGSPTTPRITPPATARSASPSSPQVARQTIIPAIPRSGSPATRQSAKKVQPAVTPGTGGALYLATTRRQQVNKDIPGENKETPDEELPDQVLAGARISVPGQLAFIDPAITRAPEKIIVAQTIAPAEDSSEDLPAEKNKLRGVLRKISQVLEKTTAQNDNDKHAILIGNLQIAL